MPKSEILSGDKFYLCCNHEGCKRVLAMVMGDPSMGYAHHKTLDSIDMRNQVWYCYQHRKLHEKRSA